MEDAYEVKLGCDKIGQVGFATAKDEITPGVEPEDLVEVQH